MLELRIIKISYMFCKCVVLSNLTKLTTFGYLYNCFLFICTDLYTVWPYIESCFYPKTNCLFINVHKIWQNQCFQKLRVSSATLIFWIITILCINRAFWNKLVKQNLLNWSTFKWIATNDHLQIQRYVWLKTVAFPIPHF